jgi:ketosteroid isomerase-like protein
MSLTRSAAALAILAGLAGCATPQRPVPAPADSPASRQVEAAMQRYTLFTGTGPPDSSAALFTADGELLEPGMRPLEGPEAIRAFLAPLWQMVTVRKAVTTTDAIEVHGDVAYQWGACDQVVAVRDQPPANYHGRLVAEWRRKPDATGESGGCWSNPRPRRSSTASEVPRAH